jgi:hypothetical protein
MVAAIATMQPERQAKFEASHRPCAPGKCDCECFFCRPDLVDAETDTQTTGEGDGSGGPSAVEVVAGAQVAMVDEDVDGGGVDEGAELHDVCGDDDNVDTKVVVNRIHYF